MPRDCETLGHVRVDQDAWCLACNLELTAKSVITVVVTRPHDELPIDSTASIQEWGPMG